MTARDELRDLWPSHAATLDARNAPEEHYEAMVDVAHRINALRDRYELVPAPEAVERWNAVADELDAA